MKIVFAGTSNFASIVLSYLDNVSLVITKPDAPKNRGQELAPSPVKELALSKNIPVLDPIKLEPAVIAQIKSEQPDVIVVVAYGVILPQEVLDIPKFGCFNIHSSLLPYHKGASPVSFSLLAMDSIGGITIIKMDTGMDTGDMVRNAPYPLDKNKDLDTIHDDLANLGGQMMKSFLADLKNHQHYSQQRQDVFLTTMCSKFEGKNTILTFNDSASRLHNRIIATSSWKSYKMTLANLDIIIKKTSDLAISHSKSAGEILELSKEKLVIACSQGALQILSLQLAGKKAVSWQEFYAGNQNKLKENLL